MTARVIPGTVGHRLLTVACAEPLSVNQLAERVDARYRLEMKPQDTFRMAVQKLAERGFLTVAHRGGGHDPSLYTISRKGEDELEGMHMNWDNTTHRVLNLASATPCSPNDFACLLTERYGSVLDNRTVRQALSDLCDLRLLKVIPSGHGHKPNRYTITRLGERRLNEMYEAHHGKQGAAA